MLENKRDVTSRVSLSSFASEPQEPLDLPELRTGDAEGLTDQINLLSFLKLANHILCLTGVNHPAAIW